MAADKEAGCCEGTVVLMVHRVLNKWQLNIVATDNVLLIYRDTWPKLQDG